ncbi:MAG TPA: manganese efflux pump MntP family protein [Rhizomicrobium sp.]|nr:manganese efflux pump MntP family protein [Rhizomicrobium sp.]
MTFLPILLLALSMSCDAFAAALGKGARLDRPGLGEALRTGLIFGGIEAITPVIGWVLGRGASRYIQAFDHWIAFGLLAVIGGKMIWDSLWRSGAEEKPQRHTFTALAVTAVGTSIDALAVGVTLALVGANIIVNALAIGAATFVMVTIGVMTGRYLGEKLGRYAEAAGGVILLVIGIKILLEHA